MEIGRYNHNRETLPLMINSDIGNELPQSRRRTTGYVF